MNKIRIMMDGFFLSLVVIFATKVHIAIYLNVEARISYYFVFFIGLFVSSWIYGLMIRPKID